MLKANTRKTQIKKHFTTFDIQFKYVFSIPNQCMLVSYSWLVEHISDPCVVILDSRGNVAYSYAHMPNSQPLGIEKVVKINQYGVNLVLGHRGANIFAQLKITRYQNVKLYDASIADWTGRRLPLA